MCCCIVEGKYVVIVCNISLHMVRNHQNRYPYINLSFFFCFWKYTETSIFLEKIIGQWIPERDGRGIARDIKKKYFYFKNLTKMVTKFGQFKIWNDPSLLFSFDFFFIYRIIKFLWKNWLVNKFRTAMDKGLLGI